MTRCARFYISFFSLNATRKRWQYTVAKVIVKMKNTPFYGPTVYIQTLRLITYLLGSTAALCTLATRKIASDTMLLLTLISDKLNINSIGNRSGHTTTLLQQRFHFSMQLFRGPSLTCVSAQKINQLNRTKSITADISYSSHHQKFYLLSRITRCDFSIVRMSDEYAAKLSHF